MPVVLRKAQRAHMPLAFIKKDATRSQLDALLEFDKRPFPPNRTGLAHSHAVPGVDAGNLGWRVVIVAIKHVWIAIRVFNGELLEIALVSRSRHIGPGILVEENDFNAQLLAFRNGILELLRSTEPGLRIVQGKIPVLSAGLPTCQLDCLHSPALTSLRVSWQVLVWELQPVFGGVDLDSLPGVHVLHPGRRLSFFVPCVSPTLVYVYPRVPGPGKRLEHQLLGVLACTGCDEGKVIGIDADRGVANLPGRVRGVRVKRIRVCRRQREVDLYSQRLCRIVVTEVEAARIPEHKAELAICTQVPQLGRGVKPVVADLVAEIRPKAIRSHAAVAPCHLSKCFVAVSWLQSREAGIRVTLHHKLAAVADLVAEMHSRPNQPDRLLVLDIEFPQAVAVKAGPRNGCTVRCGFNSRRASVPLRQIVVAMVWGRHMEPHPCAAKFPVLLLCLQTFHAASSAIEGDRDLIVFENQQVWSTRFSLNLASAFQHSRCACCQGCSQERTA